jgi:hypothetical protein
LVEMVILDMVVEVVGEAVGVASSFSMHEVI